MKKIFSNKKPKLSPEEYLEEFCIAGKAVVGTFICSNGASDGNSRCFIIPDNDRLPQSIDVEKISDRGQEIIAETISGLKVVAKFCQDSYNVNVIEVLGDEKKIGVDVLAIIRAHNLIEEFPHEVVAEAKLVAKIDPQEIERRENLRERMIITIDPADAKDLDDAVSLEKKPDGTYELGVHIADVSHYVRENSLLDEEAFARGTSVYFPGGVIPMLPVHLSNNICSLQPNVDRLALSCFMTIDTNGKVLKSRISETIINTQIRYSYDEVQDILDSKTSCKKDVKAILQNMAELAVIVEKTRKARGEVILDIPEPKIILDENGKIADVVAYPHLLAHRIIETFMIICNEAISNFALDHSLPFVYRIHEKPDPMKVNRLTEMLKPFGVQHTLKSEYPSGHDYQKLLGKITDENLKRVISQLALRSMQKAKYSPECLGHFGLGSKAYCHFTSPIRRYPDLVVHRIIKLMLNRKLSSHKLSELTGFVDRAADQSTKTELTATEVEREVDDLKCAQYMSERIGEQFDGIISGITEFGAFVYLPNTVEGLIKMENLPRDHGKEYYRFNETQCTLSSPNRTLKMGDPITVTCIGVNLSRRQVEFGCNNIK